MPSRLSLAVTLMVRRSDTLKPILILLALLWPQFSSAQISTGTLTGTLHDVEGEPSKASVMISSEMGFRAMVNSDGHGEFFLTLPYGHYELRVQTRGISTSSAVAIDIAPLQNREISLTLDSSGKLRLEAPPTEEAGVWTISPRRESYPEAFSFAGVMLGRDPATAAQPLNFAGLGDNRLAWQSQRGLSWTGTEFELMGMDASDSFQPGRPVILPNLSSLDELVERSGFAQTTSHAYAAELGFFPSQPNSSWHGDLSTSGTGAALSSSNLPPPAARGSVQQTEQYRWFTRDSVEAGGALAKWVDLVLSGAGEWTSQTVPIANPGNNLNSRMLFADSRLRVQASPRDQLDLLYSGSRLDLFDWALPAGVEVLSGQRMAPSFDSPYGFHNESESDRFNFFQAGWSHIAPDGLLGTLQTRYQYSVAHLDTTPLNALPQSRIELLGGDVTGAAPLANSAAETRQQVTADWQPSPFHVIRSRHQILIAADFESSSPTNRFTTPSDMNLITAAAVPAFAVEFNTPAVSRSIIRTSTLTFADRVKLGQNLSLDIGVIADFARGSLTAQWSAGGTFVPARAVGSQADLIVWNSISPRAGFAWLVPHGDGLVLRATYFRVYTPLAGRYLDFGNPDSLGGTAYQWIDHNADGVFEPGELGALVLHFGGPYSSISPSLGRPFADEFDVGAEFAPNRTLNMRLSFFRRDDRRRIAAMNTGVPASAFTPVAILDPGPDGILGTFDDQRLTVYQQNPTTFGQDHYLLTNPPDFRMKEKGLQAEIRVRHRNLFLDATFVAEESYGPTNPGNAVFENDSGVVGSLYMDANTFVNTSGRPFMDRAYLGKFWGSYRLPLVGLELSAIADYNDGLAFARQILVTGLAQGPFVIDATSRGTQLFNPLSGNRAEGIINTNLRLSRKFRLPIGMFDAALDVMNVANSGYKLQENELTGTSFNLRLPVEIQPARFARIQLRYVF
jgi:hypothetical protein